MPREYLVTMLLPAIGHFVNGSQIRTNTGTPTNISFFTTIIGYPSVNKSSATEAILNACLTIEKHIGIKPEESRVNCSATVESLLTELKNASPRLIQIWDEAVTLLQSFGLYKQGGAAYDRSIMSTLYNSSALVRRQTKSGNIAVKNPVLNIAAAAHPADIFSSVSSQLTKEKTTSSHKAATYFSKVVIDPNWDTETLNSFSKKLAQYNISLKAYQASFNTEPSTYTTEEETTGDDNSMDLSPSREDIVISPPQPTIPPRIGIQTTASQSTNRGFLTPPPPRRNLKTLQRNRTQISDYFAAASNLTPQKYIYPAPSPTKKKQNRTNRTTNISFCVSS
ncbi:unnamed protein product [Rotaria sp. Silwood2]|nr:unnamed protein product [Rotaria sp. Silwood2]CAF4164431.1 unnamed protein product [Rotaria sp. Silwood2]